MSLKKELGLKDSILLVINSIVGTGIFFVPQITAKLVGIYSYLAWIVLGVFSLLYSFIIADFLHRYPKAGGIYEYVKQHLGNFFGFLAGWIEILASWVTISMILSLVSRNFSEILGINYLAFAILVLFIFHILVYLGIRESKYSLLFFSFWTIFTLIVVIYYLLNIKTNPKYIGSFSLPLFTLACFYAFESYARWENITFLAEEAKNPKKDLPIALLIGNFISIFFYFIISFLLIFVYLTYQNIYNINPLGKNILIFVSTQALGTVFAWIVVIPRLLYALGRDGMIPEIFSKLHPKRKVPIYSIIFQFFFISFFILTGTFEKILNLVPPALAILYLLVSISYIKLKTEKNLTTRFLKAIAYISLFVFLGILIGGGLSSIITMLLVLSSIPLYIGIQIYKMGSLTKFLHNFFARFVDISINLWQREKYISDVLLYLFPLSGKRILDFGCATGKLSIALAKEDPSCVIYASDISEIEINILKEKIKKMKIKNVVPIVDKKDRISIKNLDAVVSIGGFGYVTNLNTFLKDLNKALKKRGKFIFIEFDNVLKIFNAPLWIKNFENLKKKFREYGFYIEIDIRKGSLWNTIYIYGFKVRDLSK